MSRSYYRTRIKFCGMTRAGDVRLAGELGVDAVGFIFARESSRRVAPAEARAMRQAIAPMVDVVALFRNNSKEEVRGAAHGAADPAAVPRRGRRELLPQLQHAVPEGDRHGRP
jgi:phosphoribosylanthranilate isomerase